MTVIIQDYNKIKKKTTISKYNGYFYLQLLLRKQGEGKYIYKKIS